jgi:parvulin-like peptidyl-prolyl isomerase
MIRILLASFLAGACALAQTAVAPAGQSVSAAPQQPAPPLIQRPFNPDSVAADAAVVTVHGVCPKNGDAGKTTACQTVITKEQFLAMLAGMNVAAQISTPAAMRNFAEGYSQLLALAGAGEQAGVDKDPRFQELMRIARLRALSESYRHSLEEKYSNPSNDEIEAYYKDNIAKYESIKVERIILPSMNTGRTPAARAENEKKLQQLADDIRERAARGEETQKLQDEAYKTLGFPATPKTDLGMKRRGTLPAGIEKDLFALKPGEVTKLEMELSGLNIYKLRSRDTIPLQFVRDEIVRELRRKNLEAAIKSVTGSVHSDLNDDFFGAPSGKGSPLLRPPSDPLYPKGLTPGSPMGAATTPGAPPAISVSPAPTKTTEPASPKPASPR